MGSLVDFLLFLGGIGAVAWLFGKSHETAGRLALMVDAEFGRLGKRVDSLRDMLTEHLARGSSEDAEGASLVAAYEEASRAIDDLRSRLGTLSARLETLEKQLGDVEMERGIPAPTLPAAFPRMPVAPVSKPAAPTVAWSSAKGPDDAMLAARWSSWYEQRMDLHRDGEAWRELRETFRSLKLDVFDLGGAFVLVTWLGRDGVREFRIFPKLGKSLESYDRAFFSGDDPDATVRRVVAPARIESKSGDIDLKGTVRLIKSGELPPESAFRVLEKGRLT